MSLAGRVVELCRALDGLSLASEPAAVRMEASGIDDLGLDATATVRLDALRARLEAELGPDAAAAAADAPDRWPAPPDGEMQSVL